MATEKLAKSVLMTLGANTDFQSHIAFRRVVHILRRSDVARKLGYSSNISGFMWLLDRLLLDRMSGAILP